MRSTATVIALATLAASTACATTSSRPEGDAGAQDTSTEQLPTCPGTGADVPSGRCDAQQPACTHAASCTPGVKIVCNTRWTCSCVAGEWSCAIAPGSGLGCTYCPGYDPAEADGRDAGDASADAPGDAGEG